MQNPSPRSESGIQAEEQGESGGLHFHKRLTRSWPGLPIHTISPNL